MVKYVTRLHKHLHERVEKGDGGIQEDQDAVLGLLLSCYIHMRKALKLLLNCIVANSISSLNPTKAILVCVSYHLTITTLAY